MFDFFWPLIKGSIIFIGIITFVHLTFYLYKFYVAMWGKARNLKEVFKTEWVMITGASSGVGRQLAYMCANQGLNIVAIGRSNEKLTKMAIDLAPKNIKFKYHAVDLADLDAPNRIFETNKDIKIGCLFICHGFNNVGRITDKSSDDIRHDLNAMTTSNILLTKLFGNQTDFGTVTYISAINADNHVSYASIYGASKRFINHFAEHMQSEGYFHNITFQAICPDFIADTEFYRDMPQKIKDCAKDGVAPERVANAILATAGRNFTCDIGWDTIIIRFFMWILPDFLQDKFFKMAGYNMMKEIWDHQMHHAKTD